MTVCTVAMTTLCVIVILLAFLLQRHVTKANQYKVALTRLKRQVLTMSTDQVELINRERARHRHSECHCARHALFELRQTIMSDILAPLVEALRGVPD